MARKAKKRKYSRGASKDVKNEMHRYKRGTAKSGRGGKGGKVKSRKQAIAIGLSKARKKGTKVPRKTTPSAWAAGRPARERSPRQPVRAPLTPPVRGSAASPSHALPPPRTRPP